MELDVDLLKKICANYGVEIIEMESGGFQFNNEEMKKIVDKMVRSRYSFNRVLFGKVSQEQILDEIHKQELILKGLRKKYNNFLF